MTDIDTTKLCDTCMIVDFKVLFSSQTKLFLLGTLKEKFDHLACPLGALSEASPEMNLENH
jgi:hypothetical protein